jgi:hypothetical protein
MVTAGLIGFYLFCWAAPLVHAIEWFGKLGFMLYRGCIYVQFFAAAMSLWQLRLELLWRQVERGEVLGRALQWLCRVGDCDGWPRTGFVPGHRHPALAIVADAGCPEVCAAYIDQQQALGVGMPAE